MVLVVPLPGRCLYVSIIYKQYDRKNFTGKLKFPFMNQCKVLSVCYGLNGNRSCRVLFQKRNILWLDNVKVYQSTAEYQGLLFEVCIWKVITHPLCDLNIASVIVVSNLSSNKLV